MSKKSCFGAVFLFAVGLTVAILSACSSKTDTIRIGGVYALTGKGASYGQWIKNAVDLAVDEVNQSGGVNGRKIEVFSEDTQSDPKTSVSVFEKLISVNKIIAAIGFITSSEAMACVPVAERNQVIMITPIASTPELRGAGKFVFRTRESGQGDSFVIAEHVYNDLGIHEAAILYENAANAIGYRDAFVQRYEGLGGKITLNLTYDEGSTDFRPILTRLKAEQPKAVYIPGIGKVLGRLLKQAKELEITTQFFSSAGIEDPELCKIAGDAANGVVFAAPAFSVDSADAATKAFVDAYRKRFQEDPSVYAANAYDSAKLVVAALRVGNVTPTQIRDYLHAVKDYDGVSGRITFDEFGEVTKPVVIKKTDSLRFSLL